MTVLAAEGNPGQPIAFRAAEPATATAKPRSWSQPGDAMREIANARVWGGIHYRNSTDAGLALGQAVGRQIVDTKLRPVN